MWAFLVLALALTVRASDTNNDTAVEEKLVIARGKLLVSTYRNVNFKISSGVLIMAMKCSGFFDIVHGAV